MNTVNRAAVAVKVRQPYVDWANSLPDQKVRATLDVEPVVYLISPIETEAQVKDPLRACWKRIFEAELEAWSRDATEWPRWLTRALFDEWFEVALYESVFDAGTGELELE